MNSKQVNAIIRMRKAMDNLEAAFAEPKARKGSIKVTQSKKPSKASMAPYAYSKRTGKKSAPKNHGMSEKGGQK